MKHKAVLRRWGVLFHSKNRMDGYTAYFLRDDHQPWATFRTRREARQWAEANFGYIKRRPDLRAEPHGWKMPKVVRIRLGIVEE